MCTYVHIGRHIRAQVCVGTPQNGVPFFVEFCVRATRAYGRYYAQCFVIRAPAAGILRCADSGCTTNHACVMWFAQLTRAASRQRYEGIRIAAHIQNMHMHI